MQEKSHSNPCELVIGEYMDNDIKMINSVYDYIMKRSPGKDFDDEMWSHNCYNEDLCMRSLGYQDKCQLI